MKYRIFIKFICIGCMIVSIISCKKFLQEKPNQKLVIPSTFEDVASILEHSRVNNWDPASAERCSDNYYLTFDHWQALTSEFDRRSYTWEKDRLFAPGLPNEWGYSYDNIYRANIVLSLLDEINNRSPNDELYKRLKGSAYFIRARSYWNALQVWAKAYDIQTAHNDLGVPLRLDPDFNKPTKRASNKACYEQIISDLKEAIKLLPQVPAHPVRPSKPAALGLLARTYLSMRQYDSTFKYSNEALNLNNELIDFNTITNPNANFPIVRFNIEVLYDANMLAPTLINSSRAKIDSNLIKSYSEGDLRKTIYFRDNGNGSYGFKANYSATNAGFTGIATDEIYLMRAECFARAGKTIEALADLNHLLSYRWKTNEFIPYNTTSNSEALEIILLERRKELLMRGLRWMDIKRLNKEGFDIVLKRILNEKIYLLPPNDSRYALAIPEEVVELTGIEQN